MKLFKEKIPHNFQETVVIQPTHGWRHIDLREIWRYRELLYFLTWRDIKIRYKQTLIGAAWAIIQPLLMMVVFSIFFGNLAKVPSEGIPYPIFIYAGLLPWIYFAQSLSYSSESVVSSANLIRKVYFPRIITPISASVSGLVDFGISFIVLLGLMVYYKFLPTKEIFLFPLLVLLTFICAVGMGLWLSALNVMYRDIRHAVPFFIRLGLFITPVIYPLSIVPKDLSWILYLNPMAGLIESFRASILGYKAIPWFGLISSVFIALSIFVSGVFFFRRMEKNFADII